MSKTKAAPIEQINDKMDRILKIMVHDNFDENDKIPDKIEFLQRMGFDDNQEMAEIIGTTKNTISTEKSKLNKEKGGKQ